MQPHPPTYKPSPLSYGSPRTSPFKRPDSPASPFRRPDSPSSPSPITSNRATTPTPTSPTKLQTTITATPPSIPRGGLNVTPSPLLTARTTSREEPTVFSSPSRSETSSTATMTASHQFQPNNNNNNTATPERPPIMGGLGGRNPPTRDALSQMPPSRVREMRECFQILDRDNDGLVTREDVADMLTNLGDPPPSTTTTTPFFPPSTPHPLPLPTYLSTLSTLLHPLSSPTELLNAFSAFDERDSGEIDLRELKDALMHSTTAPAQGGGMSAGTVEEVVGGFVGRREFGREGGGIGIGARGEVFRYREWVGGLMGGEERKGEGEGGR